MSNVENSSELEIQLEKELVELLTNVDITMTIDGWPLVSYYILAAKCPKLSTIKTMIELGAELNGDCQQSALRAIFERFLSTESVDCDGVDDLVSMLLDHGADPMSKDEDGSDCVQVLIKNFWTHPNLAKVLTAIIRSNRVPIDCYLIMDLIKARPQNFEILFAVLNKPDRNIRKEVSTIQNLCDLIDWNENGDRKLDLRILLRGEYKMHL